MDNFLDNKKIALFVVNLVSKMYQLDDAVLVEFHPASRFPNPKVIKKVVKENKSTVQSQEDYMACYTELSIRYEKTKSGV